MEELGQKLTVAQLRRAELENEKLALELAKLRKRAPWFQTLLQLVPMVTALVSVLGFLWGVNLYVGAQNKEARERAAQAEREIRNAEREFMKPWIESQREAYGKALDAAAAALLSSDDKERTAAANDFWRLYYGRMVPVETKAVTAAMDNVGNCVDRSEVCDDKKIHKRLLALGTAMAGSMAQTAQISYAEFAARQFRYDARPAPPVN